MSSIENELSELINPNRSSLKGTIGISPTRVAVAGRPGFVWVKLSDNTNELVKAYNPNVASKYGLPVKIEYDGRKYVVTGVDRDRYSNWQSDAPFLPNHGSQHSAMWGAEGYDITWVDSQQFLPLLVTPQGSSGSNGVWIGKYPYRNSNGQWILAGNTGTSAIPSLSVTGATPYLLMLKDSDGSFYALTGSNISTSVTGIYSFLASLPTPPITSKDIPIAGIRAVGSGTIVGWNNIYDVRQFYQPKYVPPTGSGGYIQTIQMYNSGTYVGDSTQLSIIGLGMVQSGSRTYIYATGTGIQDAPSNNSIYGRKNGSWTVVSGTLVEAPMNGNVYGRLSGTWAQISGSFPEAPLDGNLYGRITGTWARVTGTGGGGITEAPIDNNMYVRASGTWLRITGSNSYYPIYERFFVSGTSNHFRLSAPAETLLVQLNGMTQDVKNVSLYDNGRSFILSPGFPLTTSDEVIASYPVNYTYLLVDMNGKIVLDMYNNPVIIG